MASEYVDAIVLGTVQGITEFLPVSSSAHLIICSWILDGRALPLALNLSIHLGTVVAVFIYFWRDWWNIGKASMLFAFKRQRSETSDVLIPALFIGSIPAGLVGVLWKKNIEAWFHHPASTLLPLAAVGFALWYVDLKAPSTKKGSQITIKDAFLIGIAQACALIPGVSRSGATILCARILQFERVDAAKFSFLLGTPAMVGAAFLDYKDIMTGFANPIFYVAFIVSGIVGCLSIGFLLSFLRHFSFLSFAIYRLGLAIVIAFMLWS